MKPHPMKTLILNLAKRLLVKHSHRSEVYFVVLTPAQPIAFYPEHEEQARDLAKQWGSNIQTVVQVRSESIERIF